MFENVQSYNEFLTLMESVDYSDNQIILRPSQGSGAVPVSRKKDLIPDNYSYSYSYPPTTSPMLSQVMKFYSMDMQQAKQKHHNDHNDIRQSFPPDMPSETVPEIRQQIQPHEVGLDFDVLDVPFTFPSPELQPLDLSYQQLTGLSPEEDDASSIGSYEYESDSESELQFLQADIEPEPENPIVPGLFPQMDINDDSQFLTFDKLPLNPSFIVP